MCVVDGSAYLQEVEQLVVLDPSLRVSPGHDPQHVPQTPLLQAKLEPLHAQHAVWATMHISFHPSEAVCVWWRKGSVLLARLHRISEDTSP